VSAASFPALAKCARTGHPQLWWLLANGVEGWATRAMAEEPWELTQVREMLDDRYDNLKSGRGSHWTVKRPSPNFDVKARSAASIRNE
jgi:hypothetical protein